VELQDKLALLADAAKYDASCASSGAKRKRPTDGFGNTTGMGICHAYTPDGRCVSLLKILLTNRCIFDCAYCINRVSSDVPRAAFTVDEVVKLTVAFYRRNMIEGLFLSSGIVGSSDHTMELLCEVGRKLREVERFGGYIHLKAVAGASQPLLDKASLYADRLSVNIELPTQSDLDELAPAKSVAQTEQSMGELHALERAGKERTALGGRARPRKRVPAGQSTQMVIGATPTPDASVLHTATRLYSTHRLRRVYYTAYSPTQQPHPGLPLQPVGLRREHRLYQADWLLRFYGFDVNELVLPGGNLSLDHDPKTAWALAHREQFPVDVQRAGRAQLLRVPGLGPKTVKRLLALRRRREVTVDDLQRLRVPLRRTLPFVQLASDRTAARMLDRDDLAARLVEPPAARQLDLFARAS
jgi:putative DNA modification/repair radical SAM protein